MCTLDSCPDGFCWDGITWRMTTILTVLEQTKNKPASAVDSFQVCWTSSMKGNVESAKGEEDSTLEVRVYSNCARRNCAISSMVRLRTLHSINFQASKVGN